MAITRARIGKKFCIALPIQVGIVSMLGGAAGNETSKIGPKMGGATLKVGGAK